LAGTSWIPGKNGM